MINKRPSYRVVRPAVNVPAVRALAVSRLGQLEGRIGTNIFYVVRGFGLVGVVDVERLRAAPHAYRQVLLVAILLVLDLSHGGGFPYRMVLGVAVR